MIKINKTNRFSDNTSKFGCRDLINWFWHMYSLNKMKFYKMIIVGQIHLLKINLIMINKFKSILNLIMAISLIIKKLIPFFNYLIFLIRNKWITFWLIKLLKKNFWKNFKNKLTILKMLNLFRNYKHFFKMIMLKIIWMVFIWNIRKIYWKLLQK